MYMNIIAAAVASFIVGFLWHGPLFGKMWMKLSGMDPRKAEAQRKKGMGAMAPQMAAAFVTNLVVAYVLNMFLGFAGATSLMAAVTVAAWVWLGFFATTSLGMVLWEGKSVNLYLFKNVYSLVYLAVIAAVLVSVAA